MPWPPWWHSHAPARVVQERAGELRHDTLTNSNGPCVRYSYVRCCSDFHAGFCIPTGDVEVLSLRAIGGIFDLQLVDCIRRRLWFTFLIILHYKKRNQEKTKHRKPEGEINTLTKDEIRKTKKRAKNEHEVTRTVPLVA